MQKLSVKYSTLLSIIFLFFALLCINSAEGKKEKVLSFEAAWPNVEVFFPVDLDSFAGQVYVTSLGGQIYQFANNDAVTAADVRVFFDLTDLSSPLPFFTNYYYGGDEGLLSMEFHPLYPSVPKFYTFHSSSETSVQITAWTVVNGAVDYSSADVLIEIQKPLAKMIETPYSTIYEAYLGGDLRFLKEERAFCNNQNSDSDSESDESEEDEDRRRKNKDNSDYNLYISVGYGNDDTSGQDLHNLLGKILRITPSKTSRGYTIPCTNPYVSGPSAAAGLDEIYARGLRNPRKIYFAEDPDDLFIGDVGVDYDEVDRLYNAGQNFGWPHYDGCSTSSQNLFTFPIYSYTSESSHTVTMGPYYSGPIKSLKNRMLFADLYSGQLYSIQTTNTKECKTVPVPVAVAPAAISAFVLIDNVVYVSNVFGAFYGSPNFYRLVEH